MRLFFVEGVAEEGAVEDGAAQGEFVGVFDLVADTHSARQDGNLHVRIWCQTAEDIEIGRVALHRCTQRQDNLSDTASLDTLLETVHFDIGRSDAVHGRDESAQHVIEAMVLVGILDAHHVLHVLNDADGRGIAGRVTANGAHLGLADVVAHTAVPYLAAQPDNCLAEVDRLLLVLFEQMQYQSERRLTPDAWQLGELADRQFQQP